MEGQNTVLILCRHLGGFGGEENYIMCLLDVLKAYDTHVFVTKTRLPSGFLPEPRPNLRVSSYKPLRFMKYLYTYGKDISLFIGFSADPFPGDWAVFRMLDVYPFPKLVNPAGNDVSRVIAHYDHIIWEAGNADQYGFQDHPKNLLLHPKNLPLPPLPLEASTPFYLTIFNSYNAGLKGTSMLEAVANQCRYPII